MPLITVFTPTYNRAGKISRVFKSLLNQTFNDFEWIIVDDGSTDNTKDVIEAFKKSDPGFEIKYHYQENAGKHIAINKGVGLALGKWFHIADSDDELEPRTLKTFMDTWSEIPDERKESFCGIVACCKDQYGNRISGKLPYRFIDGNWREIYYKYGFRKESFHIYKTGVMKQFPFPENIRNCYFPESFVWRKMTETYQVRVISDELRIYYINEEGDSLMSLNKRSPAEKALANCVESSNVLNYDISYFKYYPIYFFKMALIYYCFILYLSAEQKNLVQLTNKAKIFSFIFIIPGFIFSKILNAVYKK